MKKIVGFPVVDISRCIKCYQCVAECHANAIATPMDTSCSKCIKYCISMEVPCHPEKLVFIYERCIGCGICIKICPYDALHWPDAPIPDKDPSLKLSSNNT